LAERIVGVDSPAVGCSGAVALCCELTLGWGGHDFINSGLTGHFMKPPDLLPLPDEEAIGD